MDTGQQLAWIALKTMDDYGFDQRAKRVAKVRNVSRLGSHTFLDELPIAILLKASFV